MHAHAVEDLLVATPLSYAKEIVLDRFVKQRVRGHWQDRQARIQFWVFALLDGKKDHRRISEILSITEPEVRQALVSLMLEHLIEMKVHEMQSAENPLNVQLLHESFTALKPDGIIFAEAFYQRLFFLGRQMLGNDEIEQLFKKTDMRKQYEALLGALAFVIAGVLENRHIEADLADLGARHRGYGVKEVHYSIVGLALIETLQLYFGSKWTPELQQTWTQAYTFVSGAMQKAGEA